MTYTYTYTIPVIVDRKEYDKSFLDQLVESVANQLAVDKSLLYQKCRNDRVVFCRYIVWRVMRDKGYTLSECGRIFCNHDHSTVSNGLSVLTKQANTIPYLKSAYRKIIKQFGTPLIHL